LRQALHKSVIPTARIFDIKHLQDRHFDQTWHAHSEFQLFVVLSGTGTRFIGDSIKAFGPGELIFTGPHLPHLWRSDEVYFEKKSKLEIEGIVIYFNENFLGDDIIEKQEMAGLKKLFSKSMHGLEFYGQTRVQVVDMMRKLIHLNNTQSIICLLQILDLLSSTKEYKLISSIAYKDIFNEDETDRMNVVYEFVMKNFKQKILLQDIADLVFMTPTSFSRYFTTRNNKSFSKFISEIRIKHACKLLSETEDSIEHICYECGFNTLSNFNKQFKEVVGQQPSQYKKEVYSFIGL
jgi:AraC-like DNA-binding protein